MKIMGQGMTEYIIVVALIAVAAIGVYSAFGDVLRGQTSVAAVALSGESNTSGRALVTGGRSKANEQATTKSLKDFEK
jgi:Flp pilus assembly pilin Flp